MLIVLIYIIALFISVHYITANIDLSKAQKRMNIYISLFFPIWGILLKLGSSGPAKGSHHYTTKKSYNDETTYDETTNDDVIRSMNDDYPASPGSDANTNDFN